MYCLLVCLLCVAFTTDPGTEVRAAYRFFVGHNENVEDSVLEAEAAEHGDLEILDFQDTYTSLPQKVWHLSQFVSPFPLLCAQDNACVIPLSKQT